MKRFVVMLDSGTKEQHAKFIEYLRSLKVGWWHWLDQSYLIATDRESVTPALLRDALCETFPGVHNLVLEVQASRRNWAGFGPTGKRNMFGWIRETWFKPEA